MFFIKMFHPQNNYNRGGKLSILASPKLIKRNAFMRGNQINKTNFKIIEQLTFLRARNHLSELVNGK